MQYLYFKKQDKVNFQILINMNIKCEVVQVDCNKGKFTYWLKSLEDKYPYTINEYFITENNLQPTITTMQKEEKKDKGWLIAETEKPAIIWFHKKSLIDKILNKKAIVQEPPKSKKESLARFPVNFEFTLLKD